MNNMTRINSSHSLLALSLLLLLSACGGGSPDQGGVSTSGTDDTTSDCNLTSNEKEMLKQVNAARATSRSCGDNEMPAVAALSWSCELKEAAEVHSSDMAKNNFFSHTGSDGLGVTSRVTAAGYSWALVGENIAVDESSISSVMASWLASPSHCSNIMFSRYTEFGSSLVTSEISDSTSYWTQVFASPI